MNVVSHGPYVSLRRHTRLSRSLKVTHFEVRLRRLPHSSKRKATFSLSRHFMRFYINFFSATTNRVATSILPQLGKGRTCTMVVFHPLRYHNPYHTSTRGVQLWVVYLGGFIRSRVTTYKYARQRENRVFGKGHFLITSINRRFKVFQRGDTCVFLSLRWSFGVVLVSRKRAWGTRFHSAKGGLL